MEFVEEESRPRFLLQSRPSSSAQQPETCKPDKLHLALCFAAAALLLFLTFSSSSLLDSQTLSFLLVWSSLSLLLAPFAPSHFTGGDPRVGLGQPLPPPPTQPQPQPEPDRRRTRSRRPDSNPPPIANPIRAHDGSARSDPDPAESEAEVEESEWTEEDVEILKKRILKHPVGEPRRWEKITEAFGRRHGLESVIRMGKGLGERRPEDKDSFAQFLKQRKVVDRRVEGEIGGGGGDGDGGAINKVWSSSEDIALLNALKAFPKEVAMRWEKVAAAVPGRGKGECMRRVAELKKNFRSAKGLNEA